LHDPGIAQHYDERLHGSPLIEADVRFAERHFDRPGRLLDLGCGTGRLLISFARRGFQVTGVDLSEEMLRLATEKAGSAGVTAELLQANLVELDHLPAESFDYAACLFSTLGMVSGAEARRRVLAHVRRLLRPGGRFVLHIHNRWFNFWYPQSRQWLLRDTLRTVFGGDAGDVEMPAHQGIAGLTLHVFTRREAVRLLREAGFRIREVRALGLGAECRLAWPWWFAWLRAYGYLIAAEV
jgi:ubiquinone/menaquinone biosynthesis C-methylase UbiE